MAKRVPKELRVTKAAQGLQDKKERREKWAYRAHQEQMGQKETKETLDRRVCRITISSRSQDPPDCPAPWVLQESRGLKAWMVPRERRGIVVRRGSTATQDQLVSLVPQGSLAYLVPKERRESRGSQDWMVSQDSEERKERRVKEGRRVSEESQGEKEPKGRRGNLALLDWISPAPWDQMDCQ